MNQHQVPPHRRSHCLLALCLALTAVALVLAGCKSGEPEPEDHHPTEFVRASGHPCRC